MEKYTKPTICILCTCDTICAVSGYNAPELTDSDYNPWADEN